MDDAEVARFWHDARGDVSALAKLGIAAAIVASAAAVVALLTGLDRQFGAGSWTPPLRADLAAEVGVAFLVVVVVAVAALAGVRGVSWWTRAPLVLAIVQVALLVVGAIAWYAQPAALRHCVGPPIVDRIPFHWIGLASGALVIVLAATVRWRRWCEGAVVFAVALLLALGAWLPWIAGSTPVVDALPRLDRLDGHARGLLPGAIAMPLMIAAGVTLAIIMVRSTGRVSRKAVTVGAAGVGAIYLLVLVTIDPSAATARIYGSFAHLLVGSVIIAWCALIALAIAQGRPVRRAPASPLPSTQEGLVVADAVRAPVAHLRFDGWLAGFSIAAGAFRLRTRAGELRVAAGARVLASLDPWTARAAAGDAHGVVHDGDRVAVTGFVAPPADGPFRASGAPVAGSNGVVVIAGRDPAASGRRDLVLALWRPCLLVVLATLLAALPAISIARAADVEHQQCPAE